MTIPNQPATNYAKNEKLSKEYGLIVSPVKKTFFVKDQKANGTFHQYETSQLCLVPLMNSSTSQFLDAWLPQQTYKEDGVTPYHHEVIVQFGYPINRYVRCGVCRKNSIMPDAHHLVLMSSETVEDILSKMVGKNLQIMVQPDHSAEDKV